MESRMRYHMPISITRCPTGLLYITNNFLASNRISKILFNNAKKGANGNAATKIVTNPYCSTAIFKTLRFKWLIQIHISNFNKSNTATHF